jgi:hypothetical protein
VLYELPTSKMLNLIIFYFSRKLIIGSLTLVLLEVTTKNITCYCRNCGTVQVLSCNNQTHIISKNKQSTMENKRKNLILRVGVFVLVAFLLCSFSVVVVVVDAVAVAVAVTVKAPPPKKSPVAPLSIFQTLVAGGSARAISQFSTYPFDALRTISQTRKGAKTLRELGTSKLLAGSVSTSLFAFPLGAVQFTVFGTVKKILSPIVGNTAASAGITGTAVAIASSACASLASCAVGVPQEVLKQRLVTNIYPNFGTAVQTIWKTEGLKGFYVGWGPTIARNLPYIVITFTTFNHWKTQELKKREDNKEGSTKTLDTKTALRFGMVCKYYVPKCKTKNENRRTK